MISSSEKELMFRETLRVSSASLHIEGAELPQKTVGSCAAKTLMEEFVTLHSVCSLILIRAKEVVFEVFNQISSLRCVVCVFKEKPAAQTPSNCRLLINITSACLLILFHCSSDCFDSYSNELVASVFVDQGSFQTSPEELGPSPASV